MASVASAVTAAETANPSAMLGRVPLRIARDCRPASASGRSRAGRTRLQISPRPLIGAQELG